ncbi:MAG TPA: tetratricopeptide repeat protein [Thermoanaerobaculia bacterium]|nr:tetratricopeptide repeat protein [Thermoanaerobaculia bacterium]
MVRRKTTRLIAFSLVALAAAVVIAKVAAAPPNLAKTLEVQRRLATEHPNDAAVFNDLGNLLLLVPQPAEAETAYRRALELDPNKVSALFNLGLLLQQRGEWKEAMQLYQRVVKADSGHAWAHYQMGAIHEAQRQPARAIDEYARAFSLDPQLAFPQVNPNVVESKLLTEAMLRAYRSDFSQPQAPKVYEDAGRIAALLVPPPAPPAEAKDQPAAAQPPAKPGQQPAARPGTAGARPPAGPGTKGATVLRERDLDRNNPTGQALPSGMVRPTTPSTGGGRPPIARGGLREWNRPEPQVQPQVQPQEVPSEDGDGENDGAQPAPIVTPPPGGVYYRPGLQSTGRLDLDVAPQRPAKLARVSRN